MEESFPRGREPSSAPLEAKRPRESVTQAPHFDKRTKTRRQYVKPESENAFLESLEESGHIPKHADPLRFWELKPGTKVWGVVTDVNPKGLVLSLPHGLRALVPAAEAVEADQVALAAVPGRASKDAPRQPPPLSRLFRRHQFVRAVVAAVRGGGAESEDEADTLQGGVSQRSRRRVDLSLRLSRVQGSVAPSTLVPGRALAARVLSLEDHGAVLSFGLPDVRGFLPAAEVGEDVVPGRLLEAVLVEKKGTVFRVTAVPGVAAASRLDDARELDMESLLPGTLVAAQVKRHLVDGLWLGFLTHFTGTVERHHLGVRPKLAKQGEAGNASAAKKGASKPAATELQAQLRRRYDVGQRVAARILAVDPSSARVTLSLLPHLLAARCPDSAPAVGALVEEARVLSVRPGLGVSLELCSLAAAGAAPLGLAIPSQLRDADVRVRPSLKADALKAKGGVIKASKGSDVKGRDRDKKGSKALLSALAAQARSAAAEACRGFAAGQVVRARVVGYRPLEDLTLLSLRPSVVDEVSVSIERLTPGQRVEARLLQVSQEGGLSARLGSGIKARVHATHLSDAPAASDRVLASFADKKTIVGRVWDVDLERRLVTLTLKPSLLSGKHALLSGAAQALPGTRAHGVVCGTTDYGVFLRFFGGLRGLLHQSEIPDVPAGEPLAQHFADGQLVMVTVLGLDAAGRGLKLSLLGRRALAARLEKRAEEAGKQEQVAAPGEVVHARVLRVTRRKTEDEEDEGEVIFADLVLRRTEDEVGPTLGTLGRILVSHLSDHAPAAGQLAAALRPGLELGAVAVLHLEERQGRASKLLCTRRRELVAAAREGLLPSRLEAAPLGSLVPGVVASVTPAAVYVHFAGQLAGRVPASCALRGGERTLADAFAQGQTVWTRVAAADKARGMLSLRMRPADVGSHALGLLRSFFLDTATAAEWSEGTDRLAEDRSESAAPAPPPILSCRPGCVLAGTVHDEREYGFLVDLDLDPDIVGLLPRGAAGAKNLAVGSPVRAVALDVSPAEGVVDLCLRPELLRAAESKNKRGQASDGTFPASGGVVSDARVELVKPALGYCVVSLPGAPGGWVLGTAALPSGSEGVEVGAMLDLAVLGSGCCEDGKPVPKPPSSLFACCDRLFLARTADEQAAAERTPGVPRRSKLPARGEIVDGTITNVTPIRAEVTLESGVVGHVHVSCVGEAEGATPLSEMQLGTKLAVAVVEHLRRKKPGSVRLALSSDPQLVAACRESGAAALPAASAEATAVGTRATAWVTGAKGAWINCSLAHGGGSLFGPQALSDAVSRRAEGWVSAERALRTAKEAPQAFTKLLLEEFPVGTPLAVRIAGEDAKTGMAYLEMAAATDYSASLRLGVLSSLEHGRIKVRLGIGASAHVSLVDVHDLAAASAVEGLAVGQVIRVRVDRELKANAGAEGDTKGKVSANGAAGSSAGGSAPASGGAAAASPPALPRRLFAASLRPSQGGICAANLEDAREAALPKKGKAKAGALGLLPTPPPCDVERPAAAKSLRVGSRVWGYVRNAGRSGVFLALSPTLDARVRLRELAEGFVESPEEVWPVGRLAAGRVLRIAGDKVEVSLRPPAQLAAHIVPGATVQGAVHKFLEHGLLVDIDDGPRGMVAYAEVSDQPRADPKRLLRLGQRVVARVLRVSAGTGHVALGLKRSYFKDGEARLAVAPDAGAADEFEEELKEAVDGQEAGAVEDSEEEALESEEEAACSGEEGSDFDLDAEMLAEDAA